MLSHNNIVLAHNNIVLAHTIALYLDNIMITGHAVLSHNNKTHALAVCQHHVELFELEKLC